MASNAITIITFVIVVIMAMQWSISMAQTSCNNVLISMAPCVNYVTGSSSIPSSSCCSQLAAVVRSQPQCLCVALNGGGASLGININKTLALELPGACNVQTPPVSECNAINQSNLSPAGSPGGLPAGESEAAAPVQSGSPKTNGLNVNLILPVLVLYVVLVASGGSVGF